MKTKNNIANYTNEKNNVKAKRAKALTLPVTPSNENIAELKGILFDYVRQCNIKFII